MDLALSPADAAFRDEVRSFFERELTADIKRKVELNLPIGKADQGRWQKILHAKGWIAPGWPKEYGGTGWTPAQQYIFEDEMGRAGAPGLNPFGLSMVGPVLYTFGTPAQKTRYLPKILSSDEWWCQGYSEPGSGSDLASLKTRAVRDGDHYVINGQKIWTSLAHWADMMFCLVRTRAEGKPQEGISFVLIDMKTPGLTVNPIITIDGGHHVNMVFFQDVRVPAANLIGEENRGWTYAKFLLGFERTGIAEVSTSKKQLAQLKLIAGAESGGGTKLIEDRGFRDKVTAVEVDLMALEFTNLRFMLAAQDGKAPGAEASLLKIKGSEIQQAISELAIEALGYYAAPIDTEFTGRNEPAIGPDYAPGQMPHFLFRRAATIYGGSNEIQKNVLAKMVLGL
jgi:alkylation response protein AidB-like acyl-CoA dehydrogenase